MGYILLVDPDGEVPSLGLDGTDGRPRQLRVWRALRCASSTRQPLWRYRGRHGALQCPGSANPSVPADDRPPTWSATSTTGQEIIISLSSAKWRCRKTRCSPGSDHGALARGRNRARAPRPVRRLCRRRITGDMSAISTNSAYRTASRIIRVIADFDYADPAQAALGPFASLDEVTDDDQLSTADVATTVLFRRRPFVQRRSFGSRFICLWVSDSFLGNSAA